MTMYSTILKRIPIALIALLIVTSAQAQQTKRLTITEAISLGMDYNKQLKISQSRTDVTGTKYKQELSTLAPAISINSSVSHNSENIPFFQNFSFTGTAPYITIPATAYNYYLNSLNISQVVFAGLRGWNRLKIDKAQMRASNFDLEADKQTIRNNIIVIYYNHYKLLESKKVVDANIMIMEQRLKDVQNMQTVGMALKNDVLQVQVNLSNLQSSAAEVQSAIDISNYNMDVMLGLPEATKLEIVNDGLITIKPDFNIQTGLQDALLKRPEVKAADVRLDISHRALKVARGYYSPVISGGFNYYYNEPNQREFFVSSLHFKDSWDIGVKLSWNITNIFTNQYQTREAKLNINQAEAQHDQLSDNIKMEVNANYSSYILALDKIKLNQTSVEQANENQRMTKDQYTNGVKNITDMLNADNLAITTQINLLNAKIDAEIAYAKLLKATGNN
jgi:outer membrane protein